MSIGFAKIFIDLEKKIARWFAISILKTTTEIPSHAHFTFGTGVFEKIKSSNESHI